MRRIRHDNLIKKTSAILGNNEGTSLVLVSIIAILVLSAVVILRVAVTTFMASSNRQLNQDQAYALATSLGDSIDLLITDENFSLDDYSSGTTTIYKKSSGFQQLPNASVEAQIKVEDKDSKTIKTLVVTSSVGKATYVYSKEYYE